jgi:hypothetical protein
LHVYPNPAGNFVTIEYPELANANVKLFDVNGKLLFSESATGKDKLTLNISSYKSGAYTLTIRSNNKVVVSQIIVQ